jgi:hypothetical protein
MWGFRCWVAVKRGIGRRNLNNPRFVGVGFVLAQYNNFIIRALIRSAPTDSSVPNTVLVFLFLLY